MAEGFLKDPSWEELLDIYRRSFEANPRNYSDYRRKATGYENTPLMDMGQGSQTWNYLRQALPENVGSMQWFQNQARNIQSANNSPKWRRTLATNAMDAVSNVPLGGYTAEERLKYQQARADDLNVRTKTVDFTQVLDPNSLGADSSKAKWVPIGDSARARAAQAAGVVSADIATDGARNIWWFLNAPQAVASMAALSALHHGQKGSEDVVRAKGIPQENVQVPTMKRRGYRLAATLPSVIAMSAAVGNIGRKPGYKQVVPSAEDPRQTADPWQEALSRYFLGRTGRLLPYKEFSRERPDVSPDEYRRYKAYSFDQKTDLNPLDGDFNILGALRGTTQGIHGPEVNFMGKSIPIGTGVLPVAAGVLGARMGTKKAMKRLVDKRGTEWGGFDQLNKQKELIKTAEEKYKAKNFKTEADKVAADDWIAKQQMIADELDSRNQREILKQALLYSGTGVTGAALVGEGVEQIRRAD